MSADFSERTQWSRVSNVSGRRRVTMKNLWPILIIFALLIPFSPVGHVLLQQGEQQLCDWQTQVAQRWQHSADWWQTAWPQWLAAVEHRQMQTHAWGASQAERLGQGVDSATAATETALSDAGAQISQMFTTSLGTLQQHWHAGVESSKSLLGIATAAPPEDPSVEGDRAQPLASPPAP